MTGLKKIGKKIRNIMIVIYANCLLRIFGCFPIKKNKIMVVSYYGKGYGDNGKYVADELLRLCDNLNIYWASKKQYENTIPSKIKSVRYFSPKFFYHLATSKIWLNNSRFVLGIRKRKKQFYIQLWHGDVAFKKIEADAARALLKSYIKGAKNDSKMANIMTSGSGFFSGLCRNSFWYDGEIMECGCPRNDIFFNMSERKKIILRAREKLGIDKVDKILLYAPTFRKDGSLHNYDIGFENVLKALRKRFGGSWKIIVRLHPNIASKSKEMDIWNESVIDGTNYPDAQELLIASDILITDYSSIAFDYSLMHRPVFLFAPDYELYNKDRSFYLDYFNLPYHVAKSKKQLEKSILDFSENEYNNKLIDFLMNKVQSKETGRASKIVAQRIMKEINGTKR